MITMSAAARKYGVTYYQVQTWVHSGYLETTPTFPKNPAHFSRSFTWQEEEVLWAMVLLHRAGVKNAEAAKLARGQSGSIRKLEHALDRCKQNRARQVLKSSGG